MAEPARVRRRPSANELRARRLLAGGAVGGHLGALVVVVASGLLAGPSAAASAAVASVVTLAFYTIGLGVQVAMADAPPKQVMVAALASYGLRVTALGLALAFALSRPDVVAGMHPVAVVVATISVVVCWLTAEFVVFTRLRIPVFDHPDDPS